MAKDANPTILRQNASIGKLSAENDDEFLFDCFVHPPALESIMAPESRGMVLLGRTGSGKTALMRFIQNKQEDTSTIDLFEMSMAYVTNSDVIRFLLSLGIDLDLFFQALWKHVLCIEFIRMRYSVENEEISKSWYLRVFDVFKSDERKKKALEYLREYQGKFWITADENIKELTHQLEVKIGAEFGAELELFKATAAYDRQLSTEAKSEIVSRAKKFVNSDQLTELNFVLDLLQEYDADPMKISYLLVDRLDEHWVDESMRFSLIRALIESLKSFRKISNLKIVVALRSDVFERVLMDHTDSGFQREKYEDYLVELTWTARQLKEFVDKRIRHLYRKKYTKDAVNFYDIFKTRIGKGDPFEYILERTLRRPRDILSFVNECMSNAVGSTEIAQKHA